MSEARILETAQERPAGSLADIIVEACSLLASNENKANPSSYILAFLAVDEKLESWANTLPAKYKYRISTPDNAGRQDVYPDIDMLYTWNLQRCTRIILRQTLIETLSPQHDLLHASDAIIQENSSDICYSIPYALHFCDRPGQSGQMRAACIVPLLWPLYIAGTARTAVNTVRAWVLLQMKTIQEVTGIQRARVMALDIQRNCLS
jgi:hypothetical protein